MEFLLCGIPYPCSRNDQDEVDVETHLMEDRKLAVGVYAIGITRPSSGHVGASHSCASSRLTKRHGEKDILVQKFGVGGDAIAISTDTSWPSATAQGAMWLLGENF